ncbi:isochorismatase family protein [Streptomyces sp. NPDC048002]|uniref:isochorismatase family protein n=1 Tax=unclassified Streptomyces TaxID=2593676 RepID=UPI0033C1A2CE
MIPPRTASYAMPTAASLPGEGPPWSLEPGRSALLVQHVQNYLLRSLQDQAPVAQLLANIGRITRSARSAGVPIVYVVRGQGQRVATWPDAPGRTLSEPPVEAEARAVAHVVQPQTGDTVFTAKQYSAFARTRLGARLKELGRDQLIVVGALARTDILLTAADAWMEDLCPFVVADALIDRTRDDHDMAVRWLAGTCATVTATDSVVTAFTAGTARSAAV